MDRNGSISRAVAFLISIQLSKHSILLIPKRREMPEKEITVFCANRIIQMIPDIIRVHFLLSGIDLGVAVDDHIPGSLFPKDLLIDVRNMFMQHDRHIHRAFPGVALCVFETIG